MLRSVKSQFTPFLQWWPDVNRDTFRADALASVTGVLVVLPQGIAFASIAGMPPQYGLYAAMVPAVVAALFGSSRLLVSGPTTAASIVLFSSLSALAVPGSAEYVAYAITLTLMVGVIQFALGIARLGVLVNFVSHPVIVGFTAGAAILIAVNQLEHFLGMEVPATLDTFGTLAFLVLNSDSINPPAALVGLTTLGAGLIARQALPRLPYMLPAIVAGTAMALLVNLILEAVRWDEPVILVGTVAAALPPLSVPEFSLATIKQLAPVAFAVTLFALAEAVSIARSLAARSGQFIDGNQEFIGQGLSNIVGSFFSSYVATGSFNRSAVNYEAGACTPLAAIFAGVLLMAVVGVSAPALAYLPRSAMAGILFLIAWNLVDFRNMRRISRTGASEAVVLWVTFSATLLLELEFAIILGVMLSLVVFLRRASRPSLQARLPDPSLARHRFVTRPGSPRVSAIQDHPRQRSDLLRGGELRRGAPAGDRPAPTPPEAPPDARAKHQLRGRGRGRAAGPGGPSPPRDRRWSLSPPAQGGSPRAARAGRVSRRDRPREHLRVQGRRDRSNLPAPRPERLQGLSTSRIPRVPRGRSRRGGREPRAARAPGGPRGAGLTAPWGGSAGRPNHLHPQRECFTDLLLRPPIHSR